MYKENIIHMADTANTNTNAWLPALKAAFPLTIPICLGFLFLGASYGILMGTKGFSFAWPMCMSAFIFAGSMEFVTVNLLLSAFNPLAGFLLALMVNARHLFYGLSMLGKFKGLGWKRPYLIFGYVRRDFCHQLHRENPRRHRPWLVLLLGYAVQSAVLGDRRHTGAG